MKFWIIAAALTATPAIAHVDENLCSNAQSAEAAFSKLYLHIKAINTFCETRNSHECDLIADALNQYDQTENGLGLLALRWTATQACES